jgi:hypothetical protein
VREQANRGSDAIFDRFRQSALEAPGFKSSETTKMKDSIGNQSFDRDSLGSITEIVTNRAERSNSITHTIKSRDPGN